MLRPEVSQFCTRGGRTLHSHSNSLKSLRVLSQPVILTLIVATLVGGVLRFHGIADQLLISDEWHGLYVAASRSYGELSQSFTIGATSPPMNMLQRFMLQHVGWTEIALRMPSLIAGMALLLMFPLIIRASASPGANLIATSLLAISPSLIYFSRYVRPYSIVVLLAFIAIMSAYQWARSGHQRYVWIFAVSAVLNFGVTVIQAVQFDVDLFCPDLGIGIPPVMGRVQFVDFVPYVLACAITEPVGLVELALQFVAQVFECLEFWIIVPAGSPEVLPFGI